MSFPLPLEGGGTGAERQGEGEEAKQQRRGGEREVALAALLSAALQLGLLTSTAHVPMLTVPPLGSAWLGQVVT